MVEYIVNVKEDSSPTTVAFSLLVSSRQHSGTSLSHASALLRMRSGIGAGSVMGEWSRPPLPSAPCLSVAAALLMREDKLISAGVCASRARHRCFESSPESPCQDLLQRIPHRSAAPGIYKLTTPTAAEGGLCTVTMETLASLAKQGSWRAGG